MLNKTFGISFSKSSHTHSNKISFKDLIFLIFLFSIFSIISLYFILKEDY